MGENQDAFRHQGEQILQGLPADEPDGGDKETYVDALIEQCKKMVGDDAYQLIHDQGLKEITDNIRRDLKEFGVEFDEWFPESSLMKNKKIPILPAFFHTPSADWRRRLATSPFSVI